MPMFIDTRGHQKIAIGICGRCSCKVPYDELMPDPNSPGLMVCKDDLDDLDPWRLPARETEDISLEHPRPDVSVAVYPSLGTVLDPAPYLAPFPPPIIGDEVGNIELTTETQSPITVDKQLYLGTNDGRVLTTQQMVPLATSSGVPIHPLSLIP